MHSLSYFTILYSKHKHLVENEFLHDRKCWLAPISNSRQLFSKGTDLDFQSPTQSAFQTLIRTNHLGIFLK